MGGGRRVRRVGEGKMVGGSREKTEQIIDVDISTGDLILFLCTGLCLSKYVCVCVMGGCKIQS